MKYLGFLATREKATVQFVFFFVLIEAIWYTPNFCKVMLVRTQLGK